MFTSISTSSLPVLQRILTFSLTDGVPICNSDKGAWSRSQNGSRTGLTPPVPERVLSDLAVTQSNPRPHRDVLQSLLLLSHRNQTRLCTSIYCRLLTPLPVCLASSHYMHLIDENSPGHPSSASKSFPLWNLKPSLISHHHPISTSLISPDGPPLSVMQPPPSTGPDSFPPPCISFGLSVAPRTQIQTSGIVHAYVHSTNTIHFPKTRHPPTTPPTLAGATRITNPLSRAP
jgi:hypothetical protein